jgi:hypothetical protein
MKPPFLLLLSCALAVILPSCESTAASAQKYQVGMGLKVGWKDGGPFIGFQLLPVLRPTPPLLLPSSPVDPAGRAFDALVSPAPSSGSSGSSGKAPVPSPPPPSSSGWSSSPLT